MESCHLDADLDYESIPIFTQKESLEAFSSFTGRRIVNVVELIDQFAMTPKEAAVEAAREGNVERVRCFLDDLDFDIASVFGKVKNLKSSNSYTTGRKQEVEREVIPRILLKAASRGHLDILEFALKEYWSSVPGRNELGTFLKCSPSFQRLLNSAFYRALEKGHERIAAMIYAAYPAHPGRIRNKLFISLVRNSKTSMVQFVYNKGRVTTAANRSSLLSQRYLDVFTRARRHLFGTLEMTFKSALRAKSFDLARLLHKTKRLETKQISAGIIRSTFDNAVDACIHDHCRRGHAKLVAFLCNNEYVSRTAAEHAFTEGVDSGSVLLMKSVCNNRSISPALGAKMLVRAIRKEQFGVVNFLWGQSWI
ncbi:hypothetical protein GQ600_1183 [Phytophthora cactorum]|nr:hypothetical protein GQ600_1183 [Phytophthora cactorum]